MDLKLRVKKSLHDEDMNENNKKTCVDCKTTKTPLWRGGPAGPKTLCNACGIRYRKRRTAMVVLEKKKERAHATKATTNTTIASPNSAKNVVAGTGTNGLSESLKRRLMVLGNEFLLQRSSTVKKQRCQRRRKKLGEEEQAAFSLMALSCGSVFA